MVCATACMGAEVGLLKPGFMKPMRRLVFEAGFDECREGGRWYCSLLYGGRWKPRV